MACTFCLRDDFTNYSGEDISWTYDGYSEIESGPYVKGCGLDFDGVDDYVQAGDDSVFDISTNDFDWEIRFKTTTTSQFRLLDTRGTGPGGTQAGFQLSTSSGAASWGNTAIDNGTGTIFNPFSGVPFNLNNGNWHAIRVIWVNSTGTLEMFVDGVSQGSFSDPSLIGDDFSSSRPFTVGGASDNNGQYFEGEIDFIKINGEVFYFSECSGTTISGSSSTVLYINGPTWGISSDFNPDVSGFNPCFDAENLPDGYYKFSYTQDANSGDVKLYVGDPQEAGNPVSNAFCYQEEPSLTDCKLKFEGGGTNDRAVDTTGMVQFELPIKINFSLDDFGYSVLISKRTAGGDFWWIAYNPDNDDLGYFTNESGVTTSARFSFTPVLGQKYEFDMFDDSGDVVIELDGVEKVRDGSFIPPTDNSNNFRLGYDHADAARNLNGTISYVQVGSNIWGFQECEGDTLYGNVNLEIIGAEWQSTEVFETINLQDYFLSATQYNITYDGGSLSQFDGTNLRITTLPVGQYCFTNTANISAPEGYNEKPCVECNDSENICIDIVAPPNAGDDREVNVCNNQGEVYYQDFLVNNDGIGTFEIISENLVYGSLDSEKYTPGISDYGGSFQIAHILPHPIADVCNGISILTFNVQNCVICPDDSGLGLDVQEVVDGGSYNDKVTAAKTGSYDDPTRIASDDIYFSNDDGSTWTLADEATELDYYVRLSTTFDNDCDFGSSSGRYFLEDVELSNGEDVQEAQLRSGNGSYNNDWINITPAMELAASGSTSALISERYFRWDVRHVLNSGWVLHHVRTAFAPGDPSGPTCPPGPGGGGSALQMTSNGNPLGKRKIIFQRRITYNIPCDDLIIEEEFNPTLPDCDFDTSGLGFDIDDPQPDGGTCILGSVECVGSIAGSTSDKIFIYRKYDFSSGYSSHDINCGSSFSLDCDAEFFFIRRINFADCPPIILLHNYQSASTCSTAGISCEKQDGNARARAFRTSNPASLSSDYLQYRRGGGAWQSYSEGQWIYVSSQQTIFFRRVANYNNGCSQTTDTCSQNVNPPTWTVSTTCSGGDTLVTNVTGLPSGGVYRIYKGLSYVGFTSSNTYEVDSQGSYQVKYFINGDLYTGNTVNCGSGGSCEEPTITFGSCSIENNSITLPFTTSNVDSIGDIDISVTPGSGSFTWSSGSQTGSITVNGNPGTNYTFDGDVENSCGTDTDTHSCQIGCVNLNISNVNCDFEEDQTSFHVTVSPNDGNYPSVSGATLVAVANGTYAFIRPGTSGSFTATHPNMCSSASHTISCTCQEPNVNISMSCDNDDVYFDINVTNGQNITTDFEIYIDTVLAHTVTNTGASNYSGSFAESGLSHDWEVRYTSCGTEKTPSGSIDCSCLEPSISLSGSCDTDTINFSFTVQNEAQVNGNYTVRLNGSNESTITNTGSGTYSGSVSVTPYSSNTLRIRCTSDCTTTINSNQISPSCGCPAASIEIDSISCNPSNQNITFTTSETNVTGVDYVLNGSSVAGPGTYSGVVGNNVLTVVGEDSCSGNTVSDSANVNCGCSLNADVQIDSMNESGGVLTVNFSTTNISSAAQITFKGNGTTRPVTNLGSGNWRANFTLVEGNNTVSVEVENECGTASDSDNYDYTSCVAPTIEYLTTQCDNGYVFVYTNTTNLTHAQISTTPSSTRYGSGQNKTFRFPIGGSQTLNWSISGNNGCGTDSINGSFDNCSQTELFISDQGCSGSGCADFLFFIDNSGSISESEFADFKQSINATIDQIENSSVDARYAIVQYATSRNPVDDYDFTHNIDITVNFTSSSSSAKSWSREYPSSPVHGDFMDESLGLLIDDIGSTVNPRSGCQKHIVIFTDALDTICDNSPGCVSKCCTGYSSKITGPNNTFPSKNTLVSNGWIMSVVKYSQGDTFNYTTQKLRAVASLADEGSGSNDPVYVNPGDPEGSQETPRRYYFRNSFDGNPIPNLTSDIVGNACQLRALIGGCAASATYDWSTSGGTIVSGDGTDTIVTDGTGSYTVEITYNNGCTLEETYTY